VGAIPKELVMKKILLAVSLALAASASFAGTGIALTALVNKNDIRYFFTVRADDAAQAAQSALKNCKEFQAKNAKEFPGPCKLVMNVDRAGWFAISHSEDGGAIGMSLSPTVGEAVKGAYLQCKEQSEGKACGILPQHLEANYFMVYQ
jgi:hypothetical protein